MPRSIRSVDPIHPKSTADDIILSRPSVSPPSFPNNDTNTSSLSILTAPDNSIHAIKRLHLYKNVETPTTFETHNQRKNKNQLESIQAFESIISSILINVHITGKLETNRTVGFQQPLWKTNWYNWRVDLTKESAWVIGLIFCTSSNRKHWNVAAQLTATASNNDRSESAKKNNKKAELRRSL